MKFQFTLDEADYVDHHLFTASRSETVTKKRKRAKNGVVVAYFVMGLTLFGIGSYWGGLAFLGIAVLWFFIYPVWEERWYRRHFKAVVKENYGKVAGTAIEVEVDDEAIIAKDFTSESRISTSSLVEINELSRVILLKLITGQNLVLPKSGITNIHEGIVMLRSLAQQVGIPYNNETGWKWK